jgi:hypothetical protein
MSDKLKYFIEAWEMNGVGQTVATVQDSPGTVVTITVDDLRALLARQPAAIDKQEAKACPECGGSLTTWKCLCDPIWPGYTAPLDKEASKPDPLSEEGQREMYNRSPVEPAAPLVEQDERGAFDEIRSALDETYGFASTSPRAQENINFISEKLSEIEKARAASTSANVAQYQTKLRNPILPECDVWINVSEEGARTVREKYSDVYEVRELFERSANVAQGAELVHLDDWWVDLFAKEMKSKLANAREKGRGGWQDCAAADLSSMLRDHVEKGDPRDVANFCMFLWALRSPICDAPPAQTALTDDARDAARYRWIRDGEKDVFCVIGSNGPWGECGHQEIYDERLDDRIDAALTAAQSASGDTK